MCAVHVLMESLLCVAVVNTWPGPPVGTNISQLWEVSPTWPLAGHFLSPWTQGPLVIWITWMLLMTGELAKEQCWCRPSASTTNPALPLSPPHTGKEGRKLERKLALPNWDRKHYVYKGR
ncbi:hypothetical protein QQF64_030349 [Cirrhinus molitorella]|uniref:Uncharacterized protein n=1 Tax=Cirrhinus molitorella TaxID=172907 RepID=A0ABR3N386_9TELE